MDERAHRDFTWAQRRTLKRVVKIARKSPGEALDERDWQAYFVYAAQPSTRAGKRLLHSLPSQPRCGFCGAPFAGIGAVIVRPLGYKPSQKNPNMCSTCVESSPPGGATIEIGVVFADVRGFTTLSEREGTGAAARLLRRFYAHAEQVFFPEALIDKTIGDEVMALYVPAMIERTAGPTSDVTRARVADLMLAKGRELLDSLSRSDTAGPPLDVGIGMDFGEAFFGHVGSGAVHDFTAVGDVVNTASRLQHEAASGEIVVSARLAQYLTTPLAGSEELVLKGKDEPLRAHRVCL